MRAFSEIETGADWPIIALRHDSQAVTEESWILLISFLSDLALC
ncbi:hypothetical protein [Azospirillum palustre]